MIKNKKYTGVVISLCALMIFVCLGFCSSNRSLYLAPITEALGIKRSAFAFTDSCRFISTAVINLFFGVLISRFGARKLIGAGFASLIVSMLFYAYSNRVWGLILGSIFLGVGLSWTTTTMVGYVVNKWCKEKKGTIMGAVLAANGVGSAVATQIVTPLIYEEGNAFGYRNAYKLIVGILLVVGTLIVLCYKEKPEESVSTVDIKTTKYGKDASAFSEMIKRPEFYIICCCIFFTGFVLQGITGISSAHMKDVGLDAGFIATMVSVHSLALTGFKFLTGYLYDKYGLRFVTIICDLAALIAIVALMVMTGTKAGMLWAALYAVIAALALPLETVMLPIFAGDLFDKRAYNKVLGIFVSVNTAGYALGAPTMNAVFDVYGTYRPILLVCSIIVILIIVCLQYAIGISKKKRT